MQTHRDIQFLFDNKSYWSENDKLFHLKSPRMSQDVV